MSSHVSFRQIYVHGVHDGVSDEALLARVPGRCLRAGSVAVVTMGGPEQVEQILSRPRTFSVDGHTLRISRSSDPPVSFERFVQPPRTQVFLKGLARFTSAAAIHLSFSPDGQIQSIHRFTKSGFVRCADVRYAHCDRSRHNDDDTDAAIITFLSSSVAARVVAAGDRMINGSVVRCSFALDEPTSLDLMAGTNGWICASASIPPELTDDDAVPCSEPPPAQRSPQPAASAAGPASAQSASSFSLGTAPSAQPAPAPSASSFSFSTAPSAQQATQPAAPSAQPAPVPSASSFSFGTAPSAQPAPAPSASSFSFVSAPSAQPTFPLGASCSQPSASPSAGSGLSVAQQSLRMHPAAGPAAADILSDLLLRSVCVRACPPAGFTAREMRLLMRTIAGFESVRICREFVRRGTGVCKDRRCGGCSSCMEERQVALAAFSSKQAAEQAVQTFDHFEFDETIGSHLRVENGAGSYKNVYGIQYVMQEELQKHGWSKVSAREFAEGFCSSS